MKYFCILLFIAVFKMSTCRIFTRCELANILLKNKIPKEQVADWVCLAEENKENGLNTRKYSDMNPRHHNIAYGIFQISAYYFCEDHRHHINLCNMECEKLVDDDVTDDIACALLAVRNTDNGYRTFQSWVKNCQNITMSNFLAGCNLQE